MLNNSLISRNIILYVALFQLIDLNSTHVFIIVFFFHNLAILSILCLELQ